MDQITLNNAFLEVENITFTPAEWAQYMAHINAEMLFNCEVFLGIGLIVGALAATAGIWYYGRQG